MKKIILILSIATFSPTVYNIYGADSISISDADINKILKAKDIVKSTVNYPDTLVFHDLYTKVSGNTVTLKFTAKNAFGVPETHTKDIKVN
jgi:hypothetical protein